jgi:uncharacterized integral membrane protein|tara:strand:+ start:2028 stop:2927 length:900 start_codon:yes stop_codon:yes gene_type:complete
MTTLAFSAVRVTGTSTLRVSRPRAVAVRRAVTHRSPRVRRPIVGSASSRDENNDPATSGRTIDAFVVPGEPSFPGMYADWSVTKEDKVEVWSYRVCLTTVALTTLACASPVLVGQDLPWLSNNLSYFMGASSLGAALYLIHMYVDPIKKFMQALWVTGFAGSVGIALTTHEQVPQYVATHPAAVWLVGPMFAALTGVAFKEGMCYGKPECAALFFLIPVTLLGHLSGVIGEGGEKGLLVTWCALIAIFASRKYTQAVKDDIGDKSVFIWNAMTEVEQGEWLKVTRELDPSRYARLIQEQ